MGRKKITDEQREIIKDKLFKASNKMIIENGIENLNIRALCQEVGISYSSFYDYYKNKDELIGSKLDAMDNFFDFIEDQKLRNKSVTKNIHNFIMLYTTFASTRNIEIIKEVYRMQMNGVLSNEKYYNRPMVKILHRILQDGIDTKQLPEDISIDATTKVIIACCKGIVIDWCSYNGEYNITKITSEALKSLKTIVNAEKPKNKEKEFTQS